MTYQPMPRIQRRAVGRESRYRLQIARRRLAWLLLAAGVVGAATTAVGLLGRASGYLIVDSITGHTTGVTLIALSLLITAVLVAPFDTWHPGRVVCTVFLGLAWCGTALLLAVSSGFAQDSYLSPDGRSVLVVDEGAAMIDPTWDLTVRQNSPWIARYWTVGCFNGDDPSNALESVRWLSATSVETIDGAGQSRRIEFDATSLRPDEVVSVGCY